MTIYSYPLCILLGTILAYRYFILAQIHNFGKAHLKLNFLIALIIAAFAGGKVFLVLDNSVLQFNDILSFDFISSGGFVFYGSFLFCLGLTLIVLVLKKLAILRYLDIIAITATIVHSFGRIGCFLAGCCYGRPTEAIVGVNFPDQNHVLVHPTQLYEASFIGLLFLLLRYVIHHKPAGTTFSTYILGYASWRFILEYFRGDQRGYVFDGLFSHSQLIALVLIISLITTLLLRSNNFKITHYRV